jgi:hypothetical protein
MTSKALHLGCGTSRWMGILLVALLPVVAHATVVSTTVQGTADIYLASQAAGSSEGQDTAPANSPTLVGGLSLLAGHALTFSATGVTDGAGCASTDADGCGGFSTDGGDTTLSAYTGPAQALIGVFLGAGAPSTTPDALDFSDTSFATLAPALGVVFFIGDGLTGEGIGALQAFTVPDGATRLFLGDADGLGGTFNNTGAFSVLVNDGIAAVTLPIGSVPEPGTLAIAVLGAMGLVASRRRLTRR